MMRITLPKNLIWTRAKFHLMAIVDASDGRSEVGTVPHSPSAWSPVACPTSAPAPVNRSEAPPVTTAAPRAAGGAGALPIADAGDAGVGLIDLALTDALKAGDLGLIVLLIHDAGGIELPRVDGGDFGRYRLWRLRGRCRRGHLLGQDRGGSQEERGGNDCDERSHNYLTAWRRWKSAST